MRVRLCIDVTHALDGGGEVRIAGSGKSTHGATTAAYRVNTFPTTMIIGRDGKIRGEIRMYDPDERKQAEKRISEILDEGQ